MTWLGGGAWRLGRLKRQSTEKPAARQSRRRPRRAPARFAGPAQAARTECWEYPDEVGHGDAKIPNRKFQIPNKLQVPNAKTTFLSPCAGDGPCLLQTYRVDLGI